MMEAQTILPVDMCPGGGPITGVVGSAASGSAIAARAGELFVRAGLADGPAADEMMAISLWEPWGTGIAIGAKGFETRSWSTSRRGPLAIHAAKTPVEADYFLRVPIMREAFAKAGIEGIEGLSFGKVVCTCELVAVHRVEAIRDGLSELERALGDYSDGRFAWELKNVVRLAPAVPAKGAQGFWRWVR